MNGNRVAVGAGLVILLVVLAIQFWPMSAIRDPGNSVPVDVAQASDLEDRNAPEFAESVSRFATPEGAAHSSSRQPDSGHPSSLKSIKLLDADSGSALPDVRISCSRVKASRSEKTLVTSDTKGQVLIHEGVWQLDASEDGFGPLQQEFIVHSDGQILWLRRMRRLVVRAVDLSGVAIAGVSMRLYENGTVAAGPRATGPGGAVDFGAICVTPRLRVVATHALYRPKQTAIGNTNGLGPILCELVMARVPREDVWWLEVRNPSGATLSGVEVFVMETQGRAHEMFLGETDSEGLLRMPGRWILNGHDLIFRGSAYPFRIRELALQSNSTGRAVGRIVVPRARSGAIAVTGAPDIYGTVEWRFLQPTPRSNCGEILTRTVRANNSTPLLNTELPSGWPVRVQCWINGLLAHDELATVRGADWRLVVPLNKPMNVRRLTIHSNSGPIANIIAQGTPLKTICETAPDSPPRTRVGLDIPVDRVYLQVELDTGASIWLSGSAGKSDVTVTVEHPPRVSVNLAFKGEDGGPVRDISACLTTTSSLRGIGVPGWRWRLAKNRVRRPVDEMGRLQVDLVEGRYDIGVEHIAIRNSHGLLWRPLESSLDVHGPFAGERVIVIPRPRKVNIELEIGQGKILHQWQLWVGPYRATYGGRSCSVWLTNASHELRIVDLFGKVIGSRVLDARTGSESISIPVVGANR
jgi:hypothetical protein